MESPLGGLDNREFAIAAWILVALIGSLFIGGVRSSLAQLVKTFVTSWQLLVIFGSMVLYVGALLLLVSNGHLWTLDLASETVIWFLFTGLAVLFRSVDTRRTSDDFFKQLITSTFAVGAATEFVVNLRPLSLWLEILLIPGLVALYGTLAVSEMKPEARQVRGCLQGLTVAIGLSLVAYTVWGVVSRPEDFLTYENVLKLLLPILLTVGLIPYLYVVALLTSYGGVFSLVNWRLDPQRAVRRHAKWRAIWTGGVRLGQVRRLSRFPGRVSRDGDASAVDRAIAETLKPEEES